MDRSFKILIKNHHRIFIIKFNHWASISSHHNLWCT